MSKLFLGTEEITPTDTKLITTYTGGNGIIIAKDTINIDQSVVALKAELPKNVSQLTNDKGYLTDADLTENFDAKQDKLTAGNNITISEGNVISAIDTTYTAGEGIAIQDGVISNTRDSASWGNISGDITAQADLKAALDAKQDVLTAGANITIENGVISASGTGGGTEYTAGTGLKLTDNVFSIDDTVATVESVNASMASKQDIIDDIDIIRSNATAGKEAKDTLTNIVPEQASATNKLADKDYVNSSVATNTAYFKGTFDTLEELKAVTEVTNNDYGFVKGVDDSGNPVFDRYKFNGTEWIYEYSLNNSSFTAAQWNAVNSGVTADKITSYDTHVADTGIHVTADEKSTWNSKQSAIEDLADIRAGATLGKTALQSYIETDPTVPSHVKAITAEDITAWNNKSSFSGNYEDLTNKPTIPTVPTVVSAFENDAGYVTNEYHDSTKQDVIEDLNEIRRSIINIKGIIPAQATTDNELADKAFVNSSIATSTANFKGTFDSLEELQAVENPTSNDYAFLKETDATGNVSYSRYKYNGTAWVFEFKVNNSSFTEAQWAAIGSGVTSDKITGYDTHIANEEIHVTAEQKTSWSAKQDAIEDLATIRSGAALGATALQSYTESDPTVPAHVKAITEEDITTWNNKSSFSGSYEDLTNKPTIPTVNNNTIIIKQGDEIKGTFTLNQGEDYTVELDVGGSGTTAASQFGEINGTTTASTTELDLGRTIKKSQMVGLNVGNTLILPELYSLSTDGTKIILQNAIGADVMWSVVYVKALNVAELQEATSETSGVVKIDSTPTEGSTNAITSGAVYAALQEIKDTLSQLNSGN